MKALHNGSVIELRNGIHLEILPLELLEILPQPDRVELVSINGQAADFNASAPEPADLRIMLEAIGRYHFRVTTDSERMDLYLVVCEPALVPFVAAQCRSIGHGGQGVDAVRVRGILRAMAQRPDFDGTIDWAARPANAPSLFGA